MSVIASNSITDWDDYSQSFQSVMPSKMLELNREVASYMSGDVVDFGCGGGKIIPYVVSRPPVTSYTGIDASADMIGKARIMSQRFSAKKTTLIHNSIENAVLPRFTSGLSINSHYIWPEPMMTLRKIIKLLKPGATFVLATINDKLDMPMLLDEAEMECYAHPHWPDFREHNLAICESRNIRLLTLDQLIQQVRQAGFSVCEAHQQLYGGGLSLLVLERNAEANWM